MTDPIEQRLTSLEAEYAAGQKMLADLEAQRAQLMQTMWRIEGAIQVLKELRASAPKPEAP